MMVLRVVIALTFLGITAWFQIREHQFARLNLLPLYAIVVTLGFLTILYALLLNRAANLRAFTYLQVTVDIVLITVIVYVTGGTSSYLQVLYPLSIIGSSIMLNRRGGLIAASMSSISYGVLIDMDFYDMLPAAYKVVPFTAGAAWEDVLTTVAINILAFFTVAYLTGYLAERTASVERRLEEKEIDFEKLESLNRHIVEKIASGIMTLDERMRITSFNREAENVTGLTLREVYYRDVEEVLPGVMDVGIETAQGGTRIERSFRRRGGEERYLGFIVSKGWGGDAAYIVIFNDLTRIKAMEEQLRRDERLKALGELSVGIAHEIRNPLASISGSIQVLKDELSLDAENSHLMSIVLRETERLNSLITDYLLFARPAGDRSVSVDLCAVVNETIQVFRNSPSAVSISIESDLDEGVFIKSDERRIGQVFWNLFINAASAMPDGGALNVSSQVDVAPPGGSASRTGQDAQPGRRFVEIDVSDTGRGIAHDKIEKIFDPFFSTSETGTGLGLAIVHRIVKSYGGTILVESARGVGTTFRVFFPLEADRVPG